jgi:uncharacterized RDD family membrane protein YckC
VATSWEHSGGVVTPEAVRLQFSEANVGSRGIALLIDWFVIFVILMTFNTAVGFLLAAASGGIPSWVAITTLIIVNFLVLFGYPVAFETLQRGRTPGKSAMGLRVVTVEGAPVAFRHAAIRAALALVDFVITVGLGAVLSTLLSKRHQRLGDMVAGTVVLRERTGEDAPWASQFRIPQGAEAYAVTIDPSGLAAGDYELARSFLLRAQGLAPQPRAEIAERLAVGFARKLHHQRPATVSAELFLSCLAARYQERHGRLEQAASPPGAPPPTAPEPPGSPPPTEAWGDFSAPG